MIAYFSNYEMKKNRKRDRPELMDSSNLASETSMPFL